MNQVTCSWSLRWSTMLALTALTTTAVHAQSKPDVLMLTAIPLAYRSVFDDYQKFTDQPVASWTQSNATVERIGGWRAYAKEARQPAQTEGLDKSAVSGQPFDEHVGHGVKP